MQRLHTFITSFKLRYHMEDTTTGWQEYTILSKILQKVSKKENCNVLDLPTLYNSVDPDALATLCTASELPRGQAPRLPVG